MRKFELELYAKRWSMNHGKPTKVIEFKAEHHVVAVAEQMCKGYEEFRLWELKKERKEFVGSGAVS